MHDKYKMEIKKAKMITDRRNEVITEKMRKRLKNDLTINYDPLMKQSCTQSEPDDLINELVVN